MYTRDPDPRGSMGETVFGTDVGCSAYNYFLLPPQDPIALVASAPVGQGYGRGTVTGDPECVLVLEVAASRRCASTGSGSESDGG